MFRCPSFRKLSKISVSKILRFAKMVCFKMFQEFFLIFESMLVSPNMKIVGFGSRLHVPKSRNHRHDEFWVLMGSPINKSENHKTKSRLNNSLELLSPLFPKNYQTNYPINAEKSLKCVAVFSPIQMFNVNSCRIVNINVDYQNYCSVNEWKFRLLVHGSWPKRARPRPWGRRPPHLPT